MKNTDYAVGEATPVRNALVYTHTFSNGAKYFGNGVKQSRPYEFGSGRGKKYQEQFELDPNPTIEIIASGLTVEEADKLEQQLFDEYIANGGLKIQSRPSGKDLVNNIAMNAKVDHQNPERCKKISESKTGVPRPEATKEKMRNPKSEAHKENISKALIGVPKSKEHKESLYYKVISMFDGRVTTHNKETYWNRQNPDYIGTWVRL
jgi:hypothetical protein